MSLSWCRAREPFTNAFVAAPAGYHLPWWKLQSFYNAHLLFSIDLSVCCHVLSHTVAHDAAAWVLQSVVKPSAPAARQLSQSILRSTAVHN